MKRYIPGELIKFAHDNYNAEIYRVIEYTGKIDSGDCYEFTAELVIDKNRKKPKIKKRPLFVIDEAPVDSIGYVSFTHTVPNVPRIIETTDGPSYVSYDRLTSDTHTQLADGSYQILEQPKLHTFWDNGDFVRARSQQVLKRTSVIEGDHESRDW